MSEHSKEPWRITSIDGWDGVGTVPDARGFADDVCKLVFNNPANARRIVACVNACRGISTEALESIKDAWIMKSLEGKGNYVADLKL